MTGASSRPPRGGWDPLDALVFHDTATAPGLVLKCNIIGVLEVLQKEKRKKSIRNDRRITPLCAPEPFTKDCIDAESLPPQPSAGIYPRHGGSS
jgi:Inorganic pyrophosphatase